MQTKYDLTYMSGIICMAYMFGRHLFLQFSKKGVEQTAQEIGSYLQDNVNEVHSYNVIQGFLNLNIHDSYWINQFLIACQTSNYGILNIDSNIVQINTINI